MLDYHRKESRDKERTLGALARRFIEWKEKTVLLARMSAPKREREKMVQIVFQQIEYGRASVAVREQIMSNKK